MQTKHKIAKWKCVFLCQSKIRTFQTEAEFLTHIEYEHNEDFTTEEMLELANLGRYEIPRELEVAILPECPICTISFMDKDFLSVYSHIAKDLAEYAWISLSESPHAATKVSGEVSSGSASVHDGRIGQRRKSEIEADEMFPWSLWDCDSPETRSDLAHHDDDLRPIPDPSDTNVSVLDEVRSDISIVRHERLRQEPDPSKNLLREYKVEPYPQEDEDVAISFAGHIEAASNSGQQKVLEKLIQEGQSENKKMLRERTEAVVSRGEPPILEFETDALRELREYGSVTKTPVQEYLEWPVEWEEEDSENPEDSGEDDGESDGEEEHNHVKVTKRSNKYGNAVRNMTAPIESVGIMSMVPSSSKKSKKNKKKMGDANKKNKTAAAEAITETNAQPATDSAESTITPAVDSITETSLNDLPAGFERSETEIAPGSSIQLTSADAMELTEENSLDVAENFVVSNPATEVPEQTPQATVEELASPAGDRKWARDGAKEQDSKEAVANPEFKQTSPMPFELSTIMEEPEANATESDNFKQAEQDAPTYGDHLSPVLEGTEHLSEDLSEDLAPAKTVEQVSLREDIKLKQDLAKDNPIYMIDQVKDRPGTQDARQTGDLEACIKQPEVTSDSQKRTVAKSLRQIKTPAEGVRDDTVNTTLTDLGLNVDTNYILLLDGEEELPGKILSHPFDIFESGIPNAPNPIHIALEDAEAEAADKNLTEIKEKPLTRETLSHPLDIFEFDIHNTPNPINLAVHDVEAAKKG
jgi:hypothetical protein